MLRELAIRDSLTGIYNRRHFLETSQISVERSHRQNVDGFILICDIDYFKSINDTYGHIVGDKVLIEAASRIRVALRSYDLFARYGGEEFIIYVSDLRLSNVNELAERLRLSICSQEFSYDDIRFFMTVSIGVAKVDDDQDLGRAIKNADEAMYIAKNEGRNRVKIFS
jgi:diguanylate cyclase (GGDEF)-like protein